MARQDVQVLILRPLAIVAGLLGFVLVAPAGQGQAAVAAVPPLTVAAQPGQVQGLRLWTDCVDRTNFVRLANGLAALTIDVRAATAATAHSAYQARIQKMTHDQTAVGFADAGQRLRTAGYQWSTYGENVAAGQGDCATVMKAWMDSKGHRSNILNPSYRHIGMGMVVGANGVRYWTMDLAAGG